MTLAALLTPVVVPPVNLAVLAALALAAGYRRPAGLCLALLLVLGMPAVAGALTGGLERGERAGDIEGAQAIVVLGAGVVHQANGRTVPDGLTLERLRSAARLARRSGLPVLVSGGTTQSGAAPVADAMATSLREDFAVPVRWVEARSPDTLANARDAAAILTPEGIRRVLVVTDQWHMRRAMLAFAATGLDAVPAPVPPERGRGFDWGGLVPSARGWLASYYALHEWIGLAWYELRLGL